MGGAMSTGPWEQLLLLSLGSSYPLTLLPTGLQVSG